MLAIQEGAAARTVRRRTAVGVALVLAGGAMFAQAPPLNPSAPAASSCVVPESANPVTPSAPACANSILTAYDGLLVFAPHPDDETLGFAGLIAAYLEQKKPVEVIVTTDGDAYCEACRLWKSSSVQGATCSAADLSNLATPEIDSFGEVRRGESAAAAQALGRQPPTFFGYPDTGLAAAWRNLEAGEPGKPLRRSDFSRCKDCEHCAGGYGEGPETAFSADTLMASLRDRLARTSGRTLLATTHGLDGHPDHAALGHFVERLNGELAQPRAIAYAVIHAHTRKTYFHPDCWYPRPAAPVCPCAGEEGCATADPTWVATASQERFRPDWPSELPDDAEYGAERQLCLPPELYRGPAAKKLLAVRAYASQLGALARAGQHPPGLDNLMDCNGYLISFVRRSEAFALAEPPPPGESFVSFGTYTAEEDARVVADFAGLRVADVSDAMDAVGLRDVGLVDPEIGAAWRDSEGFAHRIAGIAVTARYVPTNRAAPALDEASFADWEGDWYERLSSEPFAERLRSGAVVVIDAHDDGDTGSIGSYNVLEWKRRGAVGVVTSGGARDTDEIAKQRVPLYARRLGRGIRPGRNQIESIQRPVTLGGVLVRPGDVVVADGDGVIVVPRERAAAVARLARRVLEDDKAGRRELYRQLGLPADSSVLPQRP
jgi:regulator of RNase E activity RraA/LmbE family N-acetylglucosaminyl deacetylase